MELRAIVEAAQENCAKVQKTNQTLSPFMAKVQQKKSQDDQEMDLSLKEMVEKVKEKKPPAKENKPEKQKPKDKGYATGVEMMRLRTEIVRAAAMKEVGRLRTLALRVRNARMDPELLMETGLPWLLREEDIWRGTKVEAVVQAVLKKWTDEVREKTSKEPDWQKKPKKPPMRGLTARLFIEVVERMEEWLKNDRLDDQWDGYRRLAYDLAIRGYDTPATLDACDVEDFAFVKEDGDAKGVLQRAILAATEIGRIKRRQRCETLAVVETRRTIEVNAKVAADEWLDAKKVERSMEQADRVLENMAIRSEKPAVRMEEMGQAGQMGKDVQSPLMNKCLLTILECRKASLPAIRSAVRSWHLFALMVLMVPLGSTLQPVCSMHVMMWLCCLKNHGTAQNYYGHLVFFVKFMGGDLSWIDGRMELYMKSRKKLKMDDMNVVKSCPFLLTSAHIRCLVEHFERRGEKWFLVLVLVGWNFLLRMASEAFPLEKGAQEERDNLPEGRHSAVWVDGNFTTHIRLARRKNRPKGSYLQRKCSCASTGKRLCVGHRLQECIAHLPPGEKIFAAVQQHVMKAEIRKVLGQTEPKAKQFGFKGFRAGHATEMAKLGGAWPKFCWPGNGQVERSCAMLMSTNWKKGNSWR